MVTHGCKSRQHLNQTKKSQQNYLDLFCTCQASSGTHNCDMREHYLPPAFKLMAIIVKLPFHHLQWRVLHLKSCWWPEQHQWSLHHCCEWACTRVTWFCTLSAFQFHLWTDDPAIHRDSAQLKHNVRTYLQNKSRIPFYFQMMVQWNAQLIRSLCLPNHKFYYKTIWQTWRG